jgi:hypothetical protein
MDLFLQSETYFIRFLSESSKIEKFDELPGVRSHAGNTEMLGLKLKSRRKCLKFNT